MRSFALPCGIPGGTRGTSDQQGSLQDVWALFSPVGHPLTSIPAQHPQAPSPGSRCGPGMEGPACSEQSQPCATGAVAPPALTHHVQFTPSSLTGLPLLPRALPPILPPLGFRDTIPFPLPVTSCNSPSWTFCSGLHSFPEPHWAPGRSPQSVLPWPESMSSLPPTTPVLSGLCPQCQRLKRAKTVLVCWSGGSRGDGQALGSGQLAQSPSSPVAVPSADSCVPQFSELR